MAQSENRKARINTICRVVAEEFGIDANEAATVLWGTISNVLDAEALETFINK